MICWDRHDGAIIGYFSLRQVRWLRVHLKTVHNALQADLDLWEARSDLNDPAIPLATWCSTGLPHEPDGLDLQIARCRAADVALVLDALPEFGGVVALPDFRCAAAWVWALAECGINLTQRLAQQGLMTRDPGGSRDVDRAQRIVHDALAWLDHIAEGLIEVADSPCRLPPPEDMPTID